MDDPAVDEEDVEPRFLLIGVGTAPAAADSVSAVISALQPAALILGGGWIRECLKIREIAHAAGVATLIEDDLDLAIDVDGVHLTDPSSTAVTRSKIDQNCNDRLIVGADVGLSRHDAMVAGEAGADYVAFGERGQSASDTVFELIAWWRDVTVMPCLGYAEDAETVRKLARIGTDFIGVGDALWNDIDGPLSTAETIGAAIKKN